MKKIFVVKISAILFLISTACGANTFDYYKEDFQELAQNANDRKFQGNENNLNDFGECEVLVNMGSWEQRANGKYGRSQHWRRRTMNTETGIALDLPTQYFKNLDMILDNKSLYPVYIGPWHYSQTLQKSIRFFAYQPKQGGDIKYQYESQTEENKNISEKKFSLSPTAKIAPDRFGLCVVKWTAKYGYNAIAEVKSKNRFSKNYLVPTGKIIDAEE